MSNKLQAKDLINLGLFTVLYFVIGCCVAIPIGFVPIFLPILGALWSLITGIPFMLFLTRVKKFGMVTIMGILSGLLMGLTSIAMGATNGVSILLSQAIGSKNEKRTESLIVTSFCVAVVFSIGVTAILEILLPTILNALNTPAETYAMAYSYLSIYVLGYLAIYLYCYFAAVLRSFGNSMFQAIAMLTTTILNAILDPVFIHFIGFNGAAIATVLSEGILYLCWSTLKRRNCLHLNFPVLIKRIYGC